MKKLKSIICIPSLTVIIKVGRFKWKNHKGEVRVQGSQLISFYVYLKTLFLNHFWRFHVLHLILWSISMCDEIFVPYKPLFFHDDGQLYTWQEWYLTLVADIQRMIDIILVIWDCLLTKNTGLVLLLIYWIWLFFG